MPSRIFCIGDLHGCSGTLENLLSNEIKLGKKDSLVFVGDYIDRGPDSKGVIDIILDLQEKKYDVTCLIGNHEELFMHSAEDDEIYLHWVKGCGGIQTLHSFNASTFAQLEDHYQYFFKTLLHYKIINKKYIVVHAGLNFSNEDIFADRYALLWQRGTTIDFVKLGDRIIVHGHTPQQEIETMRQLETIETNRIINIDNGCVFNSRDDLGVLTCLELTKRELFSVPNCDI
jgi:serine/threonine protein phosphatase 1